MKMGELEELSEQESGQDQFQEQYYEDGGGEDGIDMDVLQW